MTDSHTYISKQISRKKIAGQKVPYYLPAKNENVAMIFCPGLIKKGLLFILKKQFLIGVVLPVFNWCIANLLIPINC